MSAKITLTLTKFVDITTSGKFCTAVMGMAPSVSGRVSLITDIAGKQKLVVKEGYADLDFQVLAPDGSSGKFKALGICFDGPPGDARGDGSFELKNIHLDDDTVGIRNLKTKLGTYKVYFWIQRNSDGAMGIIDPDIENQN